MRSSISLGYYFTVSSTSCLVYPTVYAFRDDSVNRAESSSANCRRYSADFLAQGVSTDQYTHCDGIQGKLTDSDLGQLQECYSRADYYIWIAGRDAQVLFVFPTRVSLTTVTLQYYSDSHRGLPRLRFYAVSDDFDVWDAPTTGHPHVDVASVPTGGEPAGRRSVNINVNFNTKRVLMYKYSSSFQFEVSEVEFFNCTSKYAHLRSIRACTY